MIAIVVSEADLASEHIGEHLLELADWEPRTDPDRPVAEGGGTYHVAEGFELRTFEELHLHVDRAAEAFSAPDGPDPASGPDGDPDGRGHGNGDPDGRGDPGDDRGGRGDGPDLLAFASRHSGETGPLLTAHFTGNFADAEFGGEPRSLARAAPDALAAAVDALETHAPDGYDVGTECTHHGPTEVGCPSLFVEVGSARPQWEDPGAARAVARAILDLGEVDPPRERTVVGFGGGHYVPRFFRILRETPWTVGHVAADWALDAMGDPREAPQRSVIREAFQRSGTRRAVLDGDHPELATVVREEGFEVVSETWIREVGDRPLGLVASVEAAIGSVDEGLRFGDVVPDDFEEGGDDGSDDFEEGGDDGSGEGFPEGFVVVDLPGELLREAQGIDPDAAREAIEAHAVAFGTREGGSRAAGEAALPPEGYDALVGALADVLAGKYDSVTREDDAVLAAETAFDPEQADEAGVPEGPAFGRLAGGEPVEVDGETVRPEDVHRERTRRFPV